MKTILANNCKFLDRLRCKSRKGGEAGRRFSFPTLHPCIQPGIYFFPIFIENIGISTAAKLVMAHFSEFIHESLKKNYSKTKTNSKFKRHCYTYFVVWLYRLVVKLHAGHDYIARCPTVHYRVFSLELEKTLA